MDMMTRESMDSVGHCRGSFFMDPVLIIAGLTLSEVHTPPSEGHLWRTRASFFTESFSQLLPSPSSATSSTFSCHFAKTLQVCLEPFPISLTCDLTTTFTHVWRRPSGFPSGCSWAPCRCNLCKLVLLGGATSKPKRGDTECPLGTRCDPSTVHRKASFQVEHHLVAVGRSFCNRSKHFFGSAKVKRDSPRVLPIQLLIARVFSRVERSAPGPLELLLSRGFELMAWDG